MFNRIAERSLLALTLMLSAALSQATDNVQWPDVDYDPALPTLESVLGYAPGERISWSQDVRRYFDALAAHSEQIQVVPFGHSWEGRELFYVVISSTENMARLAANKADMQALRDPRVTSAAKAEELFGRIAPVTWLAYGVHGNEISSTDASMVTAYHLLATRGVERIDQILADTIVVLVPMQNPDGRDRFIHRFEIASGLEPSSDRLSAEHNEPWPSGRTNHYLFDMNRDWFIRTQPETRGHADAVLEWLPIAFVDLHEMGSDSTYYFAPEAVPFNPHLAADQRASLELFGRTNASWFDRYGIDYFTREVYDAFYPGYGASWPSYFGSVAMTYEQASARGLVVRRYDGSELSFEQTVRNHFLTSMGTAETVAKNHEKLLRDFYAYQQSAIDEGGSDSVRSYILPTQADQNGVDRLGALLAAQGVEVGRATESFRACSADYAAGSLVINLNQPAKRLLRTLMDRDISMEPGFVAEQERLHAKRLPDEMYDVTAWSLPFLFNVDVAVCNRTLNVASSPVEADVVPTPPLPDQATVAYLVPWGEQSAIRLLSRTLRAGMSVKSADRSFTTNGRQYPAGTLIIDVADNPEDLHQQLLGFIQETQARVVAVNYSWVSDGPSFGSERVVRMNAPRVALAWDEPVSSYSAGNLRFVIERQFDYPVTAIRMEQLRKADLSRYQVLILPDVSKPGYLETLGKTGVAELREWVKDGGVLISLARATRLLADPEADLLATRREYRLVEEAADDEDEEDTARVVGTALDADSHGAAITAIDEEPASIGGAHLHALVDEDHWLGAGVASALHILARNADVYTPLRRDEGVNVVRFADADGILDSGHLWETNRKQLAYKPVVMSESLGRGEIIAFTQDPTVRAYQDGLNVIVANAIFRAAAHARPNR